MNNDNKLQLLFSTNLFADLTLTMKDGINEITMNLHKSILFISCVYFEKLLTNCKEQNLNCITIEVPNVFIAHDIIMSFYQQETNSGNIPNWKRQLELIKCYDFFGLDFDREIIYDLKIPEENFESLLEILDFVECNNDIIKLIVNNIPENYDLTKLSKELLQEILKTDISSRIFSCSIDGTIKIWDSNTYELISTIENTRSHLQIISPFMSMSLSHDNQRIATANKYHNIRIWNAITGDLIITLLGHLRIVYNVHFSTDDQKLISCGEDCTIKIWDAKTYDLIRTIAAHTETVRCICFSLDDQNIISGGEDNYIKIWNTETGELIKTIYDDDNSIKNLCYSSSSKMFASAGTDNCIKLWDATTGNLIKTLTDKTNWTFSLCFSADNLKIISGDAKKCVRIWDIHTGKMKKLKGHSNWVLSVCFSPDNKTIISGSNDKTIKIWNAESGKLLNILLGHTDGITGICFPHNNHHELMEKIRKIADNN